MPKCTTNNIFSSDEENSDEENSSENNSDK